MVFDPFPYGDDVLILGYAVKGKLLAFPEKIRPSTILRRLKSNIYLS